MRELNERRIVLGFRHGRKAPARLVAVVVVLTMVLASCQSGTETIPTAERQLMGTFVEIKVVPFRDLPFDDAMESAFARIREIDSLMSNFKDDSEISALNRNGKAVVSRDTLAVIKRSQEIAELTDGAFDITVCPLISLWKRAAKENKLPDEAQLKATLAKVGYGKLSVDERSGVVKFAVEGMSVDLGGIAKGYAVDAAAKVLREFGCQDFLVNAGGDLYAAGTRPDGQPWHVGIQDPRYPAPMGRVMDAYLLISERAVATSGNYQQFVTIEGKRYSHIIDPRSGYPADAVPSVTVIARDCTTADALATALSVLGVEKGLKLVENLPDCEALLITVSGEKLEFHQSSGFSKFLSQPLE